MKPRNLLEHALEIVTLWYGGRLALRGQMDLGELSSAVLVAQNAFDGARWRWDTTWFKHGLNHDKTAMCM